VQKFHTMTLKMSMNRNLGRKPDYTNYEKAKIIVYLKEKIDHCLKSIISKTSV